MKQVCIYYSNYTYENAYIYICTNDCTWGEDTVHVSGLQQAVVKLLSDSLQLLIKAGGHQHVVDFLWAQLLLGVKGKKTKPTTMKHILIWITYHNLI